MKILKINDYVYETSSFTLFYNADIIRINSGEIFQEFTNIGKTLGDFCSQFLSFSLHDKERLALHYRDSSVNKERAIANIPKINLDEIRKHILEERITDSSCNALGLRKKLRHYFSITDTDLDVLELDEFKPELINSINGMVDFCNTFLRGDINE